MESCVFSLVLKCSGWAGRLAVIFGATAVAVVATWPNTARAQVANFHPCNSQPSLPICMHGYGKRIAVQRWGALPEPLRSEEHTSELQSLMRTSYPVFCF